MSDGDPPGELRWEVKHLEHRLSEGAKAFSDIRDSVAALKEEIRPRPWKVVSIVATVFVAAVGVVWAAARYPDREEFDVARRKTDDRLYELDRKVLESAGEQRLMKRDVAEIAEGQKAIREKLDQALAPRRGR